MKNRISYEAVYQYEDIEGAEEVQEVVDSREEFTEVEVEMDLLVI